MGRRSEAMTLYHRALKGRDEAFGSEHLDTLTTTMNLGEDGLLHAEGIAACCRASRLLSRLKQIDRNQALD